jgi:CubicO group peptidase (beta-lactamase class C family)
VARILCKTLLLHLLCLVCFSSQGQTADPTGDAVARLALNGPAKRYCSGIWVSQREPAEALENSVLLGDEMVGVHESGELTFTIDNARRVVSATQDGVTARARHFGDQGCIILRPETDKPLFTPQPVASSLLEAASVPWPMGDHLPATPIPNGVDIDLLDRAAEIFFANEKDRRAAFLVLHRGRIVKEAYGSGAHMNMQLESWSMGKSMTATLIGRLIEMGHLDIWDPTPVPEWQLIENDPRAAIRIADLLRMSSGLRFSGGGATEKQMAASYIPGQQDHMLGYTAPIDIFHLSASRDAEYPPNTVGRYRNSDPWMLGYVVRRIVENDLEEPYLTWPQRELFDRIGIRRFVAETDIYGNFILTGHNFGTARDWARLGLLYLNRGLWGGKRLLTEEFVDFVQSPAPAWNPPVYGGLFWLNPADESGRGMRIPSLPIDAYNAAGAGNQRTYIIPSRELVIVVMSHHAGAIFAPDRTDREYEALGLAVKAIDPTWTWDQ